MKTYTNIQLIEHGRIVMDPTCTLIPQLRIKTTNIYLDNQLQVIQDVI